MKTKEKPIEIDTYVKKESLYLVLSIVWLIAADVWQSWVCSAMAIISFVVAIVYFIWEKIHE
ncbi:MAG: hypothetical protein IJU89_01345 [Alphaproteobacteria bacterium]|nr:hypothetical protein [Alphaproteobacteria bacterium]